MALALGDLTAYSSIAAGVVAIAAQVAALTRRQRLRRDLLHDLELMQALQHRNADALIKVLGDVVEAKSAKLAELERSRLTRSHRWELERPGLVWTLVLLFLIPVPFEIVVALIQGTSYDMTRLGLVVGTLVVMAIALVAFRRYGPASRRPQPPDSSDAV